ncbi:hypothetical protein [Sorangium sp. So ce1389]|uniref:hypothetical protein n=1 Tax=Sorangium sp. So ce1389 TaxID=3133336 RepID=UPI003F5F2322
MNRQKGLWKLACAAFAMLSMALIAGCDQGGAGEVSAKGDGKSSGKEATAKVDNATQRLKGIQDAVTPHNIQIVDKREDNADRAKARSSVEDIINAHPDLDVATGLWSYNGPAIVSAVEALPRSSAHSSG